MSNKYTDIESIENYLLTNVDVTFESQIDEWIEQMSQYIEQETGRVFIADAVASEKVYDGDGEKFIIIDDCIDIDKVEVDDVEVEFLMYPSNKLPITMVKLDSGVFTKGNQNITITAKWGYSVESPLDIKFICTVLVSGIINQSNSHEGEIGSISMGRYSVSYRDDKQLKDFENIENTLKNYKRYY